KHDKGQAVLAFKEFELTELRAATNAFSREYPKPFSHQVYSLSEGIPQVAATKRNEFKAYFLEIAVAYGDIWRDPIGIKNLNAHCLKLGLASRNLWLSSPHIPECHHFYLFSARSLSQQQADVNDITSLLASSTHHILKSLIPFIKPLLQELYAQKSSGRCHYDEDVHEFTTRNSSYNWLLSARKSNSGKYGSP
ncbi:hypothetical protein Tco_0736598, partial [Tanacetum coccineum]